MTVRFRAFARFQQAQRLKMAKEFLEDQIGSFCLLARGGFIHRSPVSEYFVNKVFDRIDDVVGNWIFIWVALHWARSERKQAALVSDCPAAFTCVEDAGFCYNDCTWLKTQGYP